MSPRPYGSLSDQRQRREELQALMDGREIPSDAPVGFVSMCFMVCVSICVIWFCGAVVVKCVQGSFEVLSAKSARIRIEAERVVANRVEAARVWAAGAPARQEKWDAYVKSHNARARSYGGDDDDGTHIPGGRNDGYGTYYSTEEPTVGYGGKRFAGVTNGEYE